MLNYAEWTERLKDFVSRIRSFPGEVEAECTVARPTDAAALAKLNRSLRIKIPPEIQQFLLRASGGCTYRYHWSPDASKMPLLSELFPSETTIFGVLDLCKWQEFETNQNSCLDWVEGIEHSEGQHIWQRSFPFATLGNGDFFAVDPSRSGNPVVYLNHDFVDGGGENPTIAANFDDLLSKIEKHYYLQIWFWMDVNGLNEPGGPILFGSILALVTPRGGYTT